MPFDGIINGDFEYLCPNGTLGTTTSPADAGYWCNGEGRTLVEGSNRLLQLPKTVEAFVSQRVPVMRGHEATARIDASVRLKANGNEARITACEMTDEVYVYNSLGGQVPLSMPAGCVPPSQFISDWEFWEKHIWPGQTTSTWKVFDLCKQGSVVTLQGNPAAAAVCMGNGQLPRNTIEWNLIRVQTEKVVITWVAPRDGYVRVVGRPHRFLPPPAVPNVQISSQCEVILDVNGAAGTPPPDVLGVGDRVLASAFLAFDDANGPELLSRTRVIQGQRIHFVVDTPMATGTCGQELAMDWKPAVFYEGDKITYRIGKNLPVVPDQSDEKFIIVPFTQAYNTWQSFSLPVGADFQSRYCGGAICERPFGPLDVLLIAPPGNSRVTGFDDVHAYCDFEVADEAQLRAEIRDLATTIHDRHLLLRDRGTATLGNPPPWMMGMRPSPFEIRPMRVITGPAFNGGTCDAVEPKLLDTTLGWRYDHTDFEDRSFIAQTGLKYFIPVTGGGRILAPEYDPCTDQFQVSATNQFTTQALSSVGPWHATGDVEFLDRAYDAAVIVGAHGVMNDPVNTVDPRNGLILFTGYTINPPGNTDNADVTKMPWPWEYMYGTVRLLQAYVACSEYNAAHPTPPLRYNQTVLDSWLGAIATSVDQIAACKGFAGGLSAWNSTNLPVSHFDMWTTDWHYIGGEGSDYWGYRGGDSIDAYELLNHLESARGSLTVAEAALRSTVWNDLLVGPADAFIGVFEQANARNAQLPGDNARMWHKFRYLITKNAPQAARYRTALYLAALRALKFQYVGSTYPNQPPSGGTPVPVRAGGLWLAGGHNEYQQLDTTDYAFATRNKAAIGYFFSGMGAALVTLPQVSPERIALANALHSVFVTTDSFFSLPYGYFPKATSFQWVNALAGSEDLLSDAGAEFEPMLDPAAPVPLNQPEVQVSPAGLLPPPPALTPFTIRVRFPEALSSPNPVATLTQLAQNNLRVRRWRFLNDMTSNLQWGFEDLWGQPSAPAGPGPLSGSLCGPVPPNAWTVVPQPNGPLATPDVVELRMSNSLAQALCLSAGAGEFKIEAWAWSGDSSRYDVQISTQTW